MALMLKRKLPLLLCALALQANAGEFLCCQDKASGRRVCGDTLPGQCRGEAYRVYDSSGNLLREVGPPLSAEQKIAAAEEVRRKRERDAAEREQRRKDQALLDTYARVEDIDISQRKAENDVMLLIRDYKAKLADAQQRQQKLKNESEFYLNKAKPAGLDSDLRNAAHEIRTQAELIESKQKELMAIREKYDADRSRYFEITGRQRPASRTR